MADINQYYNDPTLEQARATASGDAGNVANMTKSINLLPYKLRDAINEKLDYNKDLITQKNDAMSNYFAAPSEARVKYADIWDPAKREALVARDTSQALVPYSNLQDILSGRMGSINNLVGAAGENARADLTAATNAAALSRQNYQDLLDMADKKTNLALDLYKTNKSAAGDGEGLDLTSLLKLMTGNTEPAANGNLESPPMSSPFGNNSFEREWPSGSGIIWTSDGVGGWL